MFVFACKWIFLPIIRMNKRKKKKLKYKQRQRLFPSHAIHTFTVITAVADLVVVPLVQLNEIFLLLSFSLFFFATSAFLLLMSCQLTRKGKKASHVLSSFDSRYAFIPACLCVRVFILRESIRHGSWTRAWNGIEKLKLSKAKQSEMKKKTNWLPNWHMPYIVLWIDQKIEIKVTRKMFKRTQKLYTACCCFSRFWSYNNQP